MPRGLKPVRRTLADGTKRIYWYHLATGRRVEGDPTTAEGMLEVAELDRRAAQVAQAETHSPRSLTALWLVYRDSPEWRALKPRTRSDYQKVRDWIGDAADKAIVARLSTPDIIRLRDKAAAAKGRRFANYVVAVLRMLLEWGKLRGWRADNPARGKLAIRRPTGARQVNRAWSEAEVRAFAAAAPPQILLPFMLGLFAGMRQGDALRVTWKAYDGGALRWIAGKNGEACLAPVTGDFKAVLDAAKSTRGDTLQIATTSSGTAWSESGYRASFFKLVRALTAAGHLQPGCTFHGLRHTIASGARDAGESDARVAYAIGDRTSAMASIYARDADKADAQTAILEAVQKRFANIERKTERKTLPKPAGPKPRKGL